MFAGQQFVQRAVRTEGIRRLRQTSWCISSMWKGQFVIILLFCGDDSIVIWLSYYVFRIFDDVSAVSVCRFVCVAVIWHVHQWPWHQLVLANCVVWYILEIFTSCCLIHCITIKLYLHVPTNSYTDLCTVTKPPQWEVLCRNKNSHWLIHTS